MSLPAYGAPTLLPFTDEINGKLSLYPSHCGNSWSVTATGEKPLVGFACINPKPFGSSVLVRFRSAAEITRAIASATNWFTPER
jgi:hypothetical protein